jgi:hypothetical protein
MRTASPWGRRSACGEERRDRGQVRRRPAKVDLYRRCTAESLMRAEGRVVDEAQLDLLHQILRY